MLDGELMQPQVSIPEVVHGPSAMWPAWVEANGRDVAAKLGDHLASTHNDVPMC